MQPLCGLPVYRSIPMSSLPQAPHPSAGQRSHLLPVLLLEGERGLQAVRLRLLVLHLGRQRCLLLLQGRNLSLALQQGAVQVQQLRAKLQRTQASRVGSGVDAAGPPPDGMSLLCSSAAACAAAARQAMTAHAAASLAAHLCQLGTCSVPCTPTLLRCFLPSISRQNRHKLGLTCCASTCSFSALAVSSPAARACCLKR